GGFRADDYCAREGFRGQGAVFSVKAQMKIAENLQGINPSFDASGFIAKDSGARPYSRKNFPGTHWARQLQRGGLIVIFSFIGGAQNSGDEKKTCDDAKKFHKSACHYLTIEEASSIVGWQLQVRAFDLQVLANC